MSTPFEHNLDIDLKFSDSRHAQIIKDALDANPELKPSIIIREIFALDDGTCRIHFSAKDPKVLRVASSSILEVVETLCETIEMFQPPSTSTTSSMSL